MIEAYLVLLFDALGHQRPIIQPVVTTSHCLREQAADSWRGRAIIQKIPLILMMLPIVTAVVAAILFLIQGGFGGGHGNFDAAIGVLLLPSILLVMHLRFTDDTPDIFIVLLPAALNLMLWVAIAIALRAVLGRKSSVCSDL
jgi:hypothetical protein